MNSPFSRHTITFKLTIISWRSGLTLLLIGMFCQAMLAKTARYRVMWKTDPSSSMVIAWDQVSGASAQLLFDQYDHGHNLAAYAYRASADHSTHAKGMYNHFVRLYNLLPSTVYYFVIVDADGPSRRMSFKTAPADPRERISIIAGGDSRNHRSARRDANLLVSKLRPTCIMFGGDMTAEGSPREWIEWLDDWQLTIGSDGRLFPVIVARGNHEADNRILVDLFDVPSAAVYYGLTLGGNLLRIYTLNSLIPEGGQQKAWLERDLATSQNVIWRFAQYHHTMRPHTVVKPEKDGLVLNWATLFHKFKVQMVVESDAHVVKTTWPIRPSNQPGSAQGFIRDDKAGTVYLGEGCWGAPLRDNNDDKIWTRNSGRFNQFKWIFVDQYKIEARTVKTDGAANVGEVNPYNIFEPPFGLNIWNPSQGDVITINSNQALTANNSPVVQRHNLTPTKTNGTTKELPKRIKADLRGHIKVPYLLGSQCNVDLILIDQKMQELARLSYEGQKSGSYNKDVDLSKAPKGEYIMVVKANGKLIARYMVDR